MIQFSYLAEKRTLNRQHGKYNSILDIDIIIHARRIYEQLLIPINPFRYVVDFENSTGLILIVCRWENISCRKVNNDMKEIMS